MNGLIANLPQNIHDLPQNIHDTFIEGDRWKYLTNGLKTTLILTFFAVIIGMVLGFLIAIVRSTHDKTGKLKFLNILARIYLTVIRGTPVMVQLLIIYYVIFAPVNIDKVFVGVLAFGLNSAAYVAEIVRSGIMSIDNGQFEAFKKQLIDEINALHIEGLPKVEKLNALVGSYVNLEYPLPSGMKAKFLNDRTTYLGNQLESEFGGERCFGVLACMDFILICTYGKDGVDPELVLYRKR